MTFAGSSILPPIKLNSINGNDALLAIIMNKASDPMDKMANNTTIICVVKALTLLLPLLFPTYVRASKKDAIVTAKVTAPFKSRFFLRLLLSAPALVVWGPDVVLATVCNEGSSFSTTSLLVLSSRMNLLIITQRIIATGTIERNVACQPKLWIIFPPAA